MLNPFPIQFLSLLAYFILRIAVGGILFHFGLKHIRQSTKLAEVFTFSFFPFGSTVAWFFITSEFILSLMFILGVSTQFAALGTMIMCLKLIIFTRYRSSPYLGNTTLYLLILACALSLFITGAGAFAYDLPI